MSCRHQNSTNRRLVLVHVPCVCTFCTCMCIFLKSHFYIISIIICFFSPQQNITIYPCQQIFILAQSTVLHPNHIDVLILFTICRSLHIQFVGYLDYFLVISAFCGSVINANKGI